MDVLGVIVREEQGPAEAGKRPRPGKQRLCGDAPAVNFGLPGWTTIGGLPYRIRRFRNRKGGVDPASPQAGLIDDHARITGPMLARAHSHGAGPGSSRGTAGSSEALEVAVARFAVSCADRTEADHSALVDAVRGGLIPAELGA